LGLPNYKRREGRFCEAPEVYSVKFGGGDGFQFAGIGRPIGATGAAPRREGMLTARCALEAAEADYSGFTRLPILRSGARAWLALPVVTDERSGG